ncbi:MAG: hypothetical protein ACKOET_06985 [Verrucomicrobiota bacterium]
MEAHPFRPRPPMPGRQQPVWLVLTVFLFLGGCVGDNQRLASVEVSASSPQVILLATQQVLEREGYRTADEPVAPMRFTKVAGRGRGLLYGTLEPGSTSTEVEVYLDSLGSGRYRLWCDAAVVRNAGDRILEDRQRLNRPGTFRKLLEEVKGLVEPAPRGTPKT